MTEVCECGFEAENGAGLAAHQRFCDEHTDGDSPDSDDDAATVSTNSFEGVELDAFERDDEACVRCESTDGLTIHRYQEGSDALPNLVTLCEECDEALRGLHHRTKRGEVNR